MDWKNFNSYWSELRKLYKDTLNSAEEIDREVFNQSFKQKSCRVIKRGIGRVIFPVYFDSNLINLKKNIYDQKIHNSPSYIMKEDGNWSQSSQETSNALLKAHFLGCRKTAFAKNFSKMIHPVELADFITAEKVKWTIGSLEPYKSPGYVMIYIP